MTNTAVQFGPGGAVIGILTDAPALGTEEPPPSVIFLNAGIVHRVGPNRIYVRLARELAVAGFSSLRFDYSGAGDSRPTNDTRPPAARSVAEVRAAMDFLQETRGASRFILTGICSGAHVSYLAAEADPRVVGLWLINPPAPKLPSRYLRILRTHPNRWRKLLLMAALRLRRRRLRAVKENRRGGDQDLPGALHRVAQRGTDILFIASEWDTGFDYLANVLPDKLKALGENGRIRVESVPGADHMFHLVDHQEQLVRLVLAASRPWTPAPLSGAKSGGSRV